MRSDNAKSGMQQAPARSLFRALGLTDEELDRLCCRMKLEIKGK